MLVVDLVAALLAIAGVLGFLAGLAALGRAHDLPAVYLLVFSLIAIRSAVHLARPRGA